MVAENRDKQLRARVQLLGNILGQVIERQVGRETYDAVEKLRKGYIKLQKEDDQTLRSELKAFIQQQEPEKLNLIIRAFNLYFSLVNLAEEEHQYYERQSQLKSDGPLWTGSVLNTIGEFKEQGLNGEQVQTLLNKLNYIPVFTAHPTE